MIIFDQSFQIRTVIVIKSLIYPESIGKNKLWLCKILRHLFANALLCMLVKAYHDWLSWSDLRFLSGKTKMTLPDIENRTPLVLLGCHTPDRRDGDQLGFGKLCLNAYIFCERPGRMSWQRVKIKFRAGAVVKNESSTVWLVQINKLDTLYLRIGFGFRSLKQKEQGKTKRIWPKTTPCTERCVNDGILFSLSVFVGDDNFFLLGCSI